MAAIEFTDLHGVQSTKVTFVGKIKKAAELLNKEQVIASSVRDIN